MKHILFNEAGELVGRYLPGSHIPADAIAVADELFLRTIREDDGVWKMVAGNVVKLPIATEVTNYSSIIANERFKREATGILVAGMEIETSRDSQALIASTGLSAILDPEYRCNFKTLNGFVEIGAEQILAIAKSVRSHVQACFDRELDLLREVEAGTYSDEMLNEGWPGYSLTPQPQ
jgi:hypothetical protein